MEWLAAGIVLQSISHGEGDAVVLAFTADHGAHRGLVRGGHARRNRAAWEVGNILDLRWVARTSEQLGSLSGEVVSAPASMLLDDERALAMLAAAAATAAGALPERVPAREAFDAFLLLLARLVNREAPLAAFVRWEVALLGDLGFGLDLGRCAVSGRTDTLRFVSPRTGRAVAESAAAPWEQRLLPLPGFLAGDVDDAEASIPDLLAGLRLTGHFLARDAFGQRHQDLPGARARLLALLRGASGDA